MAEAVVADREVAANLDRFQPAPRRRTVAPIKVVVNGVHGRVGREVLQTLCREDDMMPVGGADLVAMADSLDLPDESGSVPMSKDLADVLGDADVVVDFSSTEGAMDSIRTASSKGVNVVVGTTGFSEDDYKEAGELANTRQVGVIIAPNFAMGAVLMTHLLKQAARFFDYADLTEMHHEAKIDAPSGTAIAMAKALAEGKSGDFNTTPTEKELVANTRGGVAGGVSIHSARMPGRMAHHEVVFGALGQTLTIRHDSINRESFMPGVMMAVREVVKRPGLTIGLDKVMGL